MSQKLVQAVLVLAALSMTSAILFVTKTVMIPFILSIFLVYVISPLIEMTAKHLRLPRFLAIIVVVIVLVLGFVILFGFIGSSVRELVANSATYQARVLKLFEIALATLSDWNIPIDLSGGVGAFIKDLPIFSYFTKFSQGLLKSISDLTLVLIFAAFLLTGSPLNLPNQGTIAAVNRSIRSYLGLKFITSAVTGFLVGTFLMLIELELGFMFGLLAFLLNFIPTIGSIISTLLPIPIAFLQFTSPALVIAAISVPASIQFLVGNVIEPKLIGDNLDLHPATILLALMFWSLLWGIPGMLLATPITVILKLFLEKTRNFKGFAELMAGRIKFEEQKPIS